MKFRKKPVVVEAIRWTGENVQELAEFVAGGKLTPTTVDNIFDSLVSQTSYTWQIYFGLSRAPVPPCNPVTCLIRTLEGEMKAAVGDWVIKDVKGEFYPCKPEIFEASYERVE
jgi:hypothetical protein